MQAMAWSGAAGQILVIQHIAHVQGSRLLQLTGDLSLQVTKDITSLSSADVFSEVGKKTPVAARFSTVVHERGSPESLRDIRGFSVKFYTNEGTWDFVGNSTPVSPPFCG